MPLFHGRNVKAPLELSCDIAVVGSGAGGSMAALELGRRGFEVVLLEEGPDVRALGFSQREEEMLPRLFRQAGGQRSDDLSILVLSGRCLGGSTVHNLNLCKRTPFEILEAWREEFGLALPQKELEALFEEVESLLGVNPIREEQVSPHNRVLERGLKVLGWAGGRMHHNRNERCIGSGFCELGCAYDAKNNALSVVIPRAIEAGVTVVTDARVMRIVHDGKRAKHLVGHLLDGDGGFRGEFKVHFRGVCLSGSAIGSAVLALKSAFPNPHGQIGAHLHLHPACAVVGRFEERIEAWRGVPQSIECTEFLDFRKGSDRRIWIVPSFAHPGGAAALMPGFGPSWLEIVRSYPHLAVLTPMLHDESEGRVLLDGERPRIQYLLTPSDCEQLVMGARAAARLLWASGAREVIIPAVPPIVLRKEEDLHKVDVTRFVPNDVPLMAVHPMGTLRMGKDAHNAVVSEEGKVFGMENVWVADGSLFPTSLGVPPQISIYTFALWVARYLRLPSK
ncbi:MAG: GMC family oxidoreductase [Sandaracinaceae bacterium]|nr:GMC family oxidoreductase [Sandaracinaceae bacterium]